MTLHAIVLGAGKGTRMKSKKVKLIHKAAGKEIICHVIDNLENLNIASICVVIGYQSDDVKKVINSDKVKYAVQKEQLGTGHAVMQTEKIFEDKSGDVIILAGDAPLISAKTLDELYLFHKQNKSDITVLSTLMPDPKGYGRIVRDNSEQVLKIVEQKDANEFEKTINEINTGVYCVNKEVLFNSLKNVTTNNKQSEYYLTDIIQIAKNQDKKVFSYIAANHLEFQGINSRVHLADVSNYIYKQNGIQHMENGVTIIAPDSTYIENNVKIGEDTIIYPGTYIYSGATIGKDCTINGNCIIKSNVQIENNTKLKANTIKES